MEMVEYKIAIIGEGNDGKTSYINRLTNGHFNRHLGDDIRTATFSTNIGEIKIHFIELNNPSLIDLAKIDAIIVMFDLPNISKLEKYIPNLSLSNKEIPKVLVGTKADIGKSEIIDGEEYTTFDEISINEIFTKFHTEFSTFDAFWLVSAKSGYNIDKPLLSVINKLTNKEIRII